MLGLQLILLLLGGGGGGCMGSSLRRWGRGCSLTGCDLEVCEVAEAVEKNVPQAAHPKKRGLGWKVGGSQRVERRTRDSRRAEGSAYVSLRH